jgi:hypothetical protein
MFRCDTQNVCLFKQRKNIDTFLLQKGGCNADFLQWCIVQILLNIEVRLNVTLRMSVYLKKDKTFILFCFKKGASIQTLYNSVLYKYCLILKYV